jgi:hypothetical protein
MSRRQQEPEKKKSSKVALIVAIVLGIILLIIIGVIVLIVVLVRRAAAALKKTTNCSSDADCLFGFKCNTNTKICVQCLTTADCKDGRVCVGPVCACPTPIITDSSITVTQAWPPIIDIYIDSTGGSYETTKYKFTYTDSTGAYTVASEFLPNPGNTAPTFTFELPAVCDSLYVGYGCESGCGPTHTVSGTITLQIENECGAQSEEKLVPVSGNCDLCNDATC